MIGLIITGHGKFAEGLVDVITLVTGETENCEAVTFVPSESIDTLTSDMRAAWDRLEATCDGILVLADLPGGSPFNVAARLKMAGSAKPTEVLGGVNAPLALEAAMTHGDACDPAAFAAELLDTGRNQLLRFEMPDCSDDEIDE